VKDFWDGFEKRANGNPLKVLKNFDILFYHGTPPERNKSILEHGLKINSTSVSHHNPNNMARRAPGMIHLTSNPIYASAFGDRNESGEDIPPNVLRVVIPYEEFKDHIKVLGKEDISLASGKKVEDVSYVITKDIPKKYITHVRSYKDALDFEREHI